MALELSNRRFHTFAILVLMAGTCFMSLACMAEPPKNDEALGLIADGVPANCGDPASGDLDFPASPTASAVLYTSSESGRILVTVFVKNPDNTALEIEDKIEVRRQGVLLGSTSGGPRDIPRNDSGSIYRIRQWVPLTISDPAPGELLVHYQAVLSSCGTKAAPPVIKSRDIPSSQSADPPPVDPGGKAQDILSIPHNPGLQQGPSIPDVTLTLYRMNQGNIITTAPYGLTATDCFSSVAASPPDRWATITPVANTANAATMTSMPAQTPDPNTGKYGWLPTIKGCYFVKIDHSYGPGTSLLSPAVGVNPNDLQAAPDVTDLDFCLFRRQDSSGREIQPQVLWQSSCPTHTPTPSSTPGGIETPTEVATIGVMATATP